MKYAQFAAMAILAGVLAWGRAAHSQIPDSWTQPQKPFKVFGNTYYVGTKGLGSILITSSSGHVLIDGALPESAKQIEHNIAALGFALREVKFILNSHVHFDHAGGIARLQQASGAVLAVSAPSAIVFKTGKTESDDPQFGSLPDIEKVAKLRVVSDGETLKVGDLEFTSHLTPGHTPGGTTWTWQSCERGRCLNMVYADSLNAISAPGYRFTDTKRAPNGAQLLETSMRKVMALPCDVPIAPHPELVGLFDKLARREAGAANNPFIDPDGCRRYVALARERLDKRLAEEARP